MDHRSLRQQAELSHHERIRHYADGGAADARQDRIAVARGIHAHERHDHPGKPLTKLADGGRAEGGAAPKRLDRPGRKRRDDGGATDAMQRAVSAGLAKSFADDANKTPGRARGGRSPHKGGHVNVIVATGSPQGQDRPVPVPVPIGGPPRPPMPPPGPPPMAGPPPGAMGPGGGPPMMPPGAGMPPGLARPPMGGMMPPGMRADGGRAEAGEAHGKDVAFEMTAGAGSGLGRLAKMKMNAGVKSAAAAGD